MVIHDVIQTIGGHYGEAKEYSAVFIYSGGHWRFIRRTPLTIRMENIETGRGHLMDGIFTDEMNVPDT
ncbi:MAG: hypothetical protein LBB61_04930 [Treponema sp.]|jgi:hypothetical protein|nr:hypothetical protein [Treponema sp.]